MPDAAARFRGLLDDANDDVLEAISKGLPEDQQPNAVRAWGGILNSADREVDRASTLVFSANATKLTASKAAIDAAAAQLQASEASLEDLAKTLGEIGQTVSLFGSAVKLLD